MLVKSGMGMVIIKTHRKIIPSVNPGGVDSTHITHGVRLNPLAASPSASITTIYSNLELRKIRNDALNRAAFNYENTLS